jgi:hypothetical protein
VWVAPTEALPSRATFYQQTITRWAAALTISQVEESDADIVFAGVASGGVGKTTNNGTTWKPVLGKEGVSAVDEIAVDSDGRDTFCAGA